VQHNFFLSHAYSLPVLVSLTSQLNLTHAFT